MIQHEHFYFYHCIWHCQLRKAHTGQAVQTVQGQRGERKSTKSRAMSLLFSYLYLIHSPLNIPPDDHGEAGPWIVLLWRVEVHHRGDCQLFWTSVCSCSVSREKTWHKYVEANKLNILMTCPTPLENSDSGSCWRELREVHRISKFSICVSSCTLSTSRTCPCPSQLSVMWAQSHISPFSVKCCRLGKFVLLFCRVMDTDLKKLKLRHSRFHV